MTCIKTIKKLCELFKRQVLVSQLCLLQCDRLAGGLTKIAEAQVQLDDLNKKLAIQKVAVTEKTAACESMLETIAEGSKRATEKKELAVAKGAEIEEQSKIIVVEKVTFTFQIWLYLTDTPNLYLAL